MIVRRIVAETPGSVWIAAFAFFGLQLGFGPRYPVFRDEFYYLACADHLAMGYVDHPPLSILILAGWRSVFGDSLLSLRVLPSLAGGAIVLLTSALAGALGGSSFARTMAAVSVLAAPSLFGIAGFYSMNAFDFLFWLASFHLVLRLCRLEPAEATRTWIALGGVLGFGPLNKISVFALGAGIATVLLATSLRGHLRTRGPWIAAAITLGLFAPHVIWQIQNDWPTAEFISNAGRLKNVSLGPWGFFAAQFLDFGPLNALFWIPGLIWLLFFPGAGPGRSLGLIFGVAFLTFMNGKAYYLAPAMLAPLAAGAVVAEIWISRIQRAWARPTVLVALLLSAAVPLPVVVPLLKAEALGPYLQDIGIVPKAAERSALGVLPQHIADRFGWEELTGIVAGAWNSLSTEERAQAIIATSNYGEAGAINYYGRALGLPRAVSQHNNFFLWGPGNTAATTVITVGMSRQDLLGSFDEVVEVTALTHPLAMPYEREHPVTICRRAKRPLMELWIAGKKFI